jgi:hypothetical protein
MRAARRRLPAPPAGVCAGGATLPRGVAPLQPLLPPPQARGLALWNFEPPGGGPAGGGGSSSGGDKPAWLLPRSGAASPARESAPEQQLPKAPPSWSALAAPPPGAGPAATAAAARRTDALSRRPSRASLAFLRAVNTLSLGLLAPDAHLLADAALPSPGAFFALRNDLVVEEVDGSAPGDDAATAAAAQPPAPPSQADADALLAALQPSARPGRFLSGRDSSDASSLAALLTGVAPRGPPSLHVHAEAGDVTVRLVPLSAAAGGGGSSSNSSGSDDDLFGGSGDSSTPTLAAASSSAGSGVGLRVTASFPLDIVLVGRAVVAGDVGAVPPELRGWRDPASFAAVDAPATAAAAPSDADAAASSLMPQAARRRRLQQPATSSAPPTSTGTGGGGLLDVTLPWHSTWALAAVRVAGGASVTLVDTAPAAFPAAAAGGDAAASASTPEPARSAPTSPRLLNGGALAVYVGGSGHVRLPAGLAVDTLAVRADGRGVVDTPRARLGAAAIAASAFASLAAPGAHVTALALSARDRASVGGLHITGSGSLALGGRAPLVDVSARKGATVTTNVPAAERPDGGPAAAAGGTAA